MGRVEKSGGAAGAGGAGESLPLKEPLLSLNYVWSSFFLFSGKQPPLPDGTVVESGTTTSFEDAVKLTGFGRFHYLLMLVSGVSIMAAIMEMIDIGYVLSAASCDLDMTQGNKGTLGAITYIGIICSAHMWGVLADTTGRRRIMVLALLADVVVSVGASLSPNFAVLVVLRFLNGV
ncbi:Synaptic vesicle glycoprotein 2A, partial [Frankliniella fusca]